MDQEVLQDLFNRAVAQGYLKTIEDFSVLIANDTEVLQDNYNYVKDQGYQKTIEDFEMLVGVKPGGFTLEYQLKELLNNGTLIEIKKAEDVIDTNIFSLLEIGEEVYVGDLSEKESLRMRFLEGSLITFATIGIFIGVSLVIALISWLIKPFIVKEE